MISSLDGGVTWSLLPPFSKNNNRFGTAVTKDGELLFSTVAGNNGDDFFTKLTSDGVLVPETTGLPANEVNSLGAVFSMPLTDSGENFAITPFKSDGLVHVIKWDGQSWATIESLPNGPGNSALVGAIATDGSNIYVSTVSGQIKKWTPSAKMPFTVTAGPNQTVSLAAGATLSPTVSPAGSYTYHWGARGSPSVTFGNASALSTTAQFSQAGDYALTIKATNGSGISAGSTLIVHVTAGGTPGVKTPSRPHNFR
jgi:hypothetical protein